MVSNFYQNGVKAFLNTILLKTNCIQIMILCLVIKMYPLSFPAFNTDGGNAAEQPSSNDREQGIAVGSVLLHIPIFLTRNKIETNAHGLLGNG